MIDWDAIRTEYIYKDATMRLLAAKYDVNLTTIGRRASKEGWENLRKQHKLDAYNDANKSAYKEAQEEARNRRKDILRTWDDTVFKLYAKAEELIDKCKTTDDLNKLSGVMDKLKKLAGIMTEEEQKRFQAEIDAKIAQTEALRNEVKAEDIQIVIEGTEDTWVT